MSVETTALARREHGKESAVEFVRGDAENLPFAKASFDVVIHVESAHCLDKQFLPLWFVHTGYSREPPSEHQDRR
jgi:hypothetical protein